MNQFVQFVLAYGMPLGAAVVTSILLVVAVGIAMAWPRYIIMGYISILMLFPMTSSYGLADAADANIMYVKGTKTFFFSFLDILIFGTWVMAVLYNRAYSRRGDSLGPLLKYYIAFAALFLGHVLVGFFYPSHPFLLDFYSRGVINVLWQGMFVAILLTVVRSQRDLQQIIILMVSLVALREIFGAIRYVSYGGDPQNAYANIQNLKVKITFWDINDSILAALLLGYSTWQMLVERLRRLWLRIGYLALAILSAITIILTARRTAQGGLILAVLTLACLLPKGRKWPLIIALTLMTPAVVVVSATRGGSSGTVIEKLFFDVRTDPMADERRNRFYELKTAWATLEDNLLFGMGPAGEFRVSSDIGLEYHKGNYDFVHSGFGHILLKTGLVGLSIFSGLFICYFRHIRLNWNLLNTSQQGIVAASVSAFAAQLPNMIVGTPIGEIRTMMVLGIILALPFLVYSVSRRFPNSIRHSNHEVQSKIFANHRPIAK